MSSDNFKETQIPTLANVIFFDLKESEKGFCISLLNRSI